MWYSDPPSSRWSTPYVFIAGLVVGILLGWMFQGIIGTLVRFALLALLIAGILYFLNIWRRSNNRPSTPFDDIPEADWRDLDSRRRR
jgi:F0F1-type ATP synthase assembly protein I